LVSIICIALAVACDIFDEKITTDANTLSGKGGSVSKENAGGNDESKKNTGAADGGRDSDSGGTSAQISADGSGNNESGLGGTGEVSTSVGAATGCGDGLVSANEACDILIGKGKAGACPHGDEDCPKGDSCVEWKFNGYKGCNAACKKWEPQCQGGDGCCPSACSAKNDADCSSSCGDGIIQEGELCERASAVDGGSLREGIPVCPTKCPDDNDNNDCTKQELFGSEENCTAVCKSVRITALKGGDGCCPDGADTNKDSDCKPVCGNKIAEGNEECDSTPNCDKNCKNSTLTADQQKCLKDFNQVDTSPACEQCVCLNCTKAVLNCFFSDKETENVKCNNVLECGFSKGCVASACYCGDATGIYIGICAFPSLANGPCKSVIEDAGGTDVLTDLAAMQLDPNTTLGHAQAMSDCYDTQCKSACAR
jgi:hypothetical protein